MLRKKFSNCKKQKETKEEYESVGKDDLDKKENN
jgi:hypothetical protein